MGKYREEVKGWIKKDERSIEVAESLLESQYFPESIVRSYYGMFYITRGLLVNDGITKVTKHSSVIAFLGKNYVKTGRIAKDIHKMLTEAFNLRQKSDYELFWEADRKNAERILKNAKIVVEKFKNFLK